LNNFYNSLGLTKFKPMMTSPMAAFAEETEHAIVTATTK
jgi:hypothetical protein